ncbi:nucleoside monophosphate kinase [Candidatus Azambacteria bacterium]|nr:nucleoside monophosphate kinase [Candidatus Azambacteria bacterium]
MNEEQKPLNIILLGISGSGKGTQGGILRERYNLEYIGTGDLLRQFSKEDNAVARRMKQELAEGKLVPTWLPFYLWMNKLAHVSEKKGVLFDGSPRKIMEAELLEDVLDWYGRSNIKAILIDVSPEESFRRLINRRTCEKCGKSAYISQEKTEAICEYCGGVMRIRPEDNPEAIKTRIKWFHDEVSQVIDFFEKKGQLIRINGDQSVDDVTKDMIKAIEG